MKAITPHYIDGVMPVGDPEMKIQLSVGW